MQTGTKISAVLHVTLVAWAFLGGAFRSEPLPFDVQEVSVISEEEFAALSAPREAPEVIEGPAELQPPEPEPEEAVLPEPEPEPPEPEQVVPDPVPVPEPEPEILPEIVETPEPELPEETPTLEQPEPDVIALPEPPGVRPKPRPVERVAPEPVAPPPPETQVDEVEAPPVVAEDGAEIEQEEQQATTPEEATDRITPDAEDSAELAPTRSPRPPPRPRAAAPQQSVETEAPDQNRDQAVNDALAEALGQTTAAAAPAPTGPPMTSGEKETLRVAVSKCWNVGSLSTDALNTTVTVGVSMNQDGTPDTGSIRLLDSSGGSGTAANQAFQAARRAIIRCGAKGYDLPAEKYGQWREIEMTFNPERMRIK